MKTKHQFETVRIRTENFYDHLDYVTEQFAAERNAKLVSYVIVRVFSVGEAWELKQGLKVEVVLES